MNPEVLARRLRDAYQGVPIPPLSDGLAPGDVEGAYAVQAINTRMWLANGRRIVGRKVGLTAKVVQAQLGVDQPDYGVLFSDMEIADHGTLSPQQVIQPKVEAEIAFVMAKGLDDPQADRQVFAEAVNTVVAAIEIVDSRIADWKIRFADTVADNGSSAFFVLGADRLPIASLDLWSCGMVLEINGQVVSVGAGAACLGHPLEAGAWLARTLAKRGEPLCAGDVVLSGALGPMVAIKPGDNVRATIGGLGSVCFRFAAERA
jgi:2-keto-4-pentenoate hydratase